MSAAPARPKLAASSRTVTGKKVAYLRRDGLLPAVVYGRGLSSDNVSVDAHDFEQLRRHAGPNTLIDLSVDGGKPTPILVHEVQLHRVTRWSWTSWTRIGVALPPSTDRSISVFAPAWRRSCSNSWASTVTLSDERPRPYTTAGSLPSRRR